MIRHEKLKTIEKDLRQIAEMLLLNGNLTECSGLVNGKMGIATFFFHYAKYTYNELFADYAMDLIGEILDQLHVNSPADYEKGIAGIGVGIDYLIRNEFLNVEDDVCEDFDERMFRAVMYDPWSNFSQYDGLTGYGRYWISRLRYQVPSIDARKCLLYIIGKIEKQLPNIPAQEQTDVCCFLLDLCRIPGFEICKDLLTQFNTQTVNEFFRLGNSTIGDIVRMFQQNRYFNSNRKDEINAVMTQIPDLDIEKPPESTGLHTGYAGEGLLRLTAIEPSNVSWMILI